MKSKSKKLAKPSRVISNKNDSKSQHHPKKKIKHEYDHLSNFTYVEELFNLVNANDLEGLKEEFDLPLYFKDSKDYHGRNLLQIACIEGFYDIVEYLISMGFEVNNYTSTKSNKSILKACFAQKVCDKKKLIKLLIDHKVDVNIRDRDDRTPLHIAATTKGDLVTLKYFIDNNIYDDIYDIDDNFNNILLIASEERCHAVIEYLLSIEYNLNITNLSQESALHLCVMNKDIIATKMLINHNININIINSECLTALHLSAENNHIDILKYFIDNNIYDNIYEEDNKCNNIFHIACDWDNNNIIEYLISIEYDINKTNNKNQSGLHYSVAKGAIDTTKLLLDQNIDINAKESTDGRSALLIASEYNNLDILKYFIDNNYCNIYDVDNDGNNIFFLACERGHYDIVEYLISVGYDIHKTNNHNRTGYSIALENDREDICDLITFFETNYYN